MRSLRLLLFFTGLAEVAPDCIMLKCPPKSLNETGSGHVCKQMEPRYYVFNKNINYGCKPSVPSDCSLPSASVGGELLTFCHLPQPKVLPKPGIHPEGTHVVSVVVSRFFLEPEFQDRHPTNLTMMARFNIPEEASCQGAHGITAERRKNSTECQFRVLVAMPGIDHKSDDVDLETSFSTEMFHGASSVLFWVELTLQREVQLTSGIIHFNYIAQSPLVRYWFPGASSPPPVNKETFNSKSRVSSKSGDQPNASKLNN